jgi:Tol biopolymer transport system component
MLSKSPAARPRAATLADALDNLRANRESSAMNLPRITTLSGRFWAGMVGVLVAIACAITWFAKDKQQAPELADLTITPLTSQTGWEADPALSPDGKAVAFTWSPQLDIAAQAYIKRETDTEPIKLAGAEGGIIGHLVWSPDGKHIAFKRQFDRRGALYSISSSGQDERKLVDLVNASPSSAFDWSPDGRQLVFSDSPPDALEHQAIYLYDLQTTKKRQLTSPPLNIWGDSYPKFSPDGRTIAFKRVTGVWVDDIYLISSSGGGLRRLTYDGRGIWGLAWMPDGKSLLLSCQRNGTIFSIWRFPLKSPSNPELVAQGGGADAITPDTARHSQRVAWVNQIWDLNIYRTASSGMGQPVRRIASTRRDQDAVYAPDGRIAWISDRSGTREIWLSHEDGSNQVQITHLNGPQVDHLRWSFDGRYLAFDSGLHGSSDIFVLECLPGHLACSKPKALKISPAKSPGWSADSRSLYFSSDRTGRWEIWKQNLSGGVPVQITQRGGYYPTESADGKWLYFSDRNMDSSILRIPGSQAGRSAPVESLVLGRPYRVQQESWALGPGEIIFIDRPAHGRPATIRAFHLATEKVRSILEVPEVFLDRADIRVSVSRDGKFVLYAQLDRSGSNIVFADKNR